MPEDEKDELLNFFNSSMENLGEVLFGEHSTAEDLPQYVANLDDEKQDKFVETVNEAMFFESNDNE